MKLSLIESLLKGLTVKAFNLDYFETKRQLFKHLLNFACWYAKGNSKPAFILSALILAILFNMSLYTDSDISVQGLFWK